MRADYIKPSVYKQVYQLMQYENALALRTSLESGMRISDVLALRPCDLHGRTITYTAQKTNKRDKKVVSADLAKRLLQVSNSKFIFPGRSGDKPRTRQAVWKDVKKAAHALNVQGNLSCHSARKTYAVDEFHAKGLPTAQKELQHDRVETTMLYAYSDIITAQDSAGAQCTGGVIAEQLDRIERKIDIIDESLSALFDTSKL